jgi:hypothetical protein
MSADAFLQAAAAGDAARAEELLRADPGIAGASLHVAAAAGLEAEVRRHLARDGALVAARAGEPPGDPLLWLCYSPFLGERDDGLEAAARRGDGLSAWVLARRGGFDELAEILEGAGADREDLTPADRLLAACGRGDAEAARRLAADASLEPEDARLLPEATARGRFAVVRACLVAGFPLDAADESGATALHHASIHGEASVVRELIGLGADVRIRDREHDSDPLGWAEYGAEMGIEPGGDYEGCIRALQRITSA